MRLEQLEPLPQFRVRAALRLVILGRVPTSRDAEMFSGFEPTVVGTPLASTDHADDAVVRHPSARRQSSRRPPRTPGTTGSPAWSPAPTSGTSAATASFHDRPCTR